MYQIHRIRRYISRQVIFLVLYTGICLLAYHPINVLIQTLYVIILIAMGMDGGKVYVLRRRFKVQGALAKGTWHAETSLPLFIIATFSNIAFWWMKTPDFQPTPIHEIKIIIATIIHITTAIAWHEFMTLGRNIRTMRSSEKSKKRPG